MANCYQNGLRISRVIASWPRIIPPIVKILTSPCRSVGVEFLQPFYYCWPHVVFIEHILADVFVKRSVAVVPVALFEILVNQAYPGGIRDSFQAYRILNDNL